MKAETVVRLQSVSYAVGGAALLEDVTMQIDRGARLVLLGPSGCGKTTLLRILAGLCVPDSGAVFIGGRLVSEAGRLVVPPEKRNIGFVFQDLALWPHMTVYGNLEFGLRAKGVPRDRRRQMISDMLELTALSGLEGRRPHELSGGQQQRVALARALVAGPELVLMDEPLSSLDWDLRDRLADEICRLQGRLGFTLVYVTHDKEEARRLATETAVLKGGRIHWQDGADGSV